ncbi:unnamed protein product, partial [Mesorhabditis belari]|uniref:Uncharacterized protein n=1 Tax=Mesorhabditis belari TaxID=2138241 RepID=A0AAF3FU92_9BILA
MDCFLLTLIFSLLLKVNGGNLPKDCTDVYTLTKGQPFFAMNLDRLAGKRKDKICVDMSVFSGQALTIHATTLCTKKNEFFCVQKIPLTVNEMPLSTLLHDSATFCDQMEPVNHDGATKYRQSCFYLCQLDDCEVFQLKSILPGDETILQQASITISPHGYARDSPNDRFGSSTTVKPEKTVIWYYIVAGSLIGIICLLAVAFVFYMIIRDVREGSPIENQDSGEGAETNVRLNAYRPSHQADAKVPSSQR